MPSKRRRSHYQQLTEFERGRVVGIREGGVSFRDIVERLGRNVSTVHDWWQQWSREGTASRRPGSGRPHGTTEREDRRVRRLALVHRTASVAKIRAAVGTTVTQRTVTNRLLQGEIRARHSIACIPLTPNHYRLDVSVVKLEIIGGRSGDILCFLMKAGSALVPVMAVRWLDGGQVSACNQPICSLETLDLHLELWSGKSYDSRSTLVVIPRTLTTNLYVSLVIQHVVLPFMNSIQGCFPTG
ncbi:hypothetical protein AVEN_220591-1 [Araneus ventricosus]|uniref:Transposase IS30-like HTH domain-containing protein n=1 Tax=Araneus ventricosus TaxID=182803 RepID=A0A4Y2U8R4_ARAVE|nr:hypothetical protein AVEN_220591-1 [Araneus ventricosus]